MSCAPVPHRPADEIFLPIMSDSVDKLDAEWRREENRKLMNALLIPTECL